MGSTEDEGGCSQYSTADLRSWTWKNGGNSENLQLTFPASLANVIITYLIHETLWDNSNAEYITYSQQFGNSKIILKQKYCYNIQL